MQAALIVRARPSNVLAMNVLHVDEHGTVDRVGNFGVVKLQSCRSLRTGLFCLVGTFPVVVHLVVQVALDSARISLFDPVIVQLFIEGVRGGPLSFALASSSLPSFSTFTMHFISEFMQLIRCSSFNFERLFALILDNTFALGRHSLVLELRDKLLLDGVQLVQLLLNAQPLLFGKLDLWQFFLRQHVQNLALGRA